MIKKILVTGGAGYIGSHTVQKLIDAGYEVVVFDNLSTGFKDSIPDQCTFIQGDTLNYTDLSKAMANHKFEAILHFAAKLIVPESVAEPILYYENNVFGVINLIKAAKNHHIHKIVFSSTAAVYGDSKTLNPADEKSKVLPLTPYGWSKLMSEQILSDAEKAYGIKSVCLRYFNVAGAQVDGKNGQKTKQATHLFKVAAEAACGFRANVDIYGDDYKTKDGTGIRDYIHVEDLANIHVLALKHLISGGSSDIFNCGYGVGYSVIQVIDAIKKVSGVNFKVEVKARRVGDTCLLVADASKVKKILQWKPLFADLELIAKTTYDWEKKRALK